MAIVSISDIFGLFNPLCLFPTTFPSGEAQICQILIFGLCEPQDEHKNRGQGQIIEKNKFLERRRQTSHSNSLKNIKNGCCRAKRKYTYF